MTTQTITAQTWDKLVRERVGEPLRPERLRTLLIIVPANSGDLALATTIIRHVKDNNPDCHVTFAARPANIPLAKLCPGVQDTIELPQDLLRKSTDTSLSLSRQKYLKEYAGYADAVLYPLPFTEDKDLLTDYGLNFLEGFWLLAGTTKAEAAQATKVWLETTIAADETPRIIARCLDAAAQTRLAVRGMQRLPETLVAIARTRSIQGSGIMSIPRDISGLRNMIEIGKPAHKRRLEQASLRQRFVILGTEAVSLSQPPPGVIRRLVALLRADGRTVLHNVRDPLRAARGTVPLVCSHDEFLCLRKAGVPFVGWRSGLCDVAAATSAPLCVLFPPEHDWCRNVRVSYGMRSMGIAPDCLEIVCRSPKDLEPHAITSHIHERLNNDTHL